MLMPKELIDCMVENQNPELAKVVKHFHPKYLFPKMNFKVDLVREFGQIPPKLCIETLFNLINASSPIL